MPGLLRFVRVKHQLRPGVNESFMRVINGNMERETLFQDRHRHLRLQVLWRYTERKIIFFFSISSSCMYKDYITALVPGWYCSSNDNSFRFSCLIQVLELYRRFGNGETLHTCTSDLFSNIVNIVDISTNDCLISL